jgi:hypothetical protein
VSDDLRLHTSNPFPGVWLCVDDNYDASWEGEEDGWVSSSVVGTGKTEEEAIADYREQTEES